MGITGISGYTTNTMSRVTGLASNMDTDAIVQQAMKAQAAKYTKILQKRQVTEWRIDAYRDVTSTLQGFYKDYFDPLSTKSLKNINSFAGYSSSFATANSTEYVNVSPVSGAKAGVYSITEMKAAKTAVLSSGVSVSKDVQGAALTSPINITNENNTFRFTLNGVTKQFNLRNSVEGDTVQNYVAELQSNLDTAFGTNRVKVDTLSGSLKFKVNDTDTFSIGTVFNTGAEDIFSAVPTTESPFTLSGSNNKFELTINGVTKTVVVPYINGSGETIKYTSAGQLATAIQDAANTAFGGTANITFSGEGQKVTYSSSETVEIKQTVIDANAALGFSTANLSNKVNLSGKLSEIAGSLKTNPIDSTITDNDNIQFTINGTYFRFNSETHSISDILKAVNSNAYINATMKFDTTTNSFKIESNNTGGASRVTVEDVKGNLMQALGVEGTASGSDASITVNGATIVRPTNSFTYDGITYEIKKDFAVSADVDPIKATVSSDITKTYDFIKGFVDKYNEVIEKLNSKLKEKVYKDYLPLTDEQLAAMTEKQVEKWEEKAKSGLLKNDSIISNTLSQLRTALYAAVEGSGITLSSIGITTSSNYEDKGKLIIDETKLKEALANKPEEIANLFTKSSDVTYYDAINSSSLKSQRYKESGIAYRLSDIMQDAIRTSTDKDGKKGTLLEKAGIKGDRTEFNSLLSKELIDFDNDAYEMNKKLQERENALYKKYAAMESALNKLNEQSSWIAQQFGGN